MSFLHPARREGRRFVNPVPTEIGGFKVMLKVLPKMLRGSDNRVPRISPGPFRTDPAVYAQPAATGLRITWFGHSSLLIELDGVRILVDPVWDERAFPVRFFGPKRFFEPTLALNELPPIDAVLISHDHYDHLGASTVRQLATLMPQTRWITSAGVGNVLSSLGVERTNITELDWTNETEVRGRSGGTCTLVALPSRHFSGRRISNRFETLWASFVLRSPHHNLFYGADSGDWPGFREIGEHFGPFDLTMLEIGAFDELWHQIHLGPDGAARAFAELGGAGLLMPVHWGLFDLALHPWRQPIQRMEQLAAEHNLLLWSPEPGRPSEVALRQPLLSRWWTDSRL